MCQPLRLVIFSFFFGCFLFVIHVHGGLCVNAHFIYRHRFTNDAAYTHIELIHASGPYVCVCVCILCTVRSLHVLSLSLSLYFYLYFSHFCALSLLTVMPLTLPFICICVVTTPLSVHECVHIYLPFVVSV